PTEPMQSPQTANSPPAHTCVPLKHAPTPASAGGPTKHDCVEPGTHEHPSSGLPLLSSSKPLPQISDPCWPPPPSCPPPPLPRPDDVATPPAPVRVPSDAVVFSEQAGNSTARAPSPKSDHMVLRRSSMVRSRYTCRAARSSTSPIGRHE